eukprot:8511121-Heterocapsa_arctica.AAC.1
MGPLLLRGEGSEEVVLSSTWPPAQCEELLCLHAVHARHYLDDTVRLCARCDPLGPLRRLARPPPSWPRAW